MEFSPSSPCALASSNKTKTRHCKWNKQDDMLLTYYVSLCNGSPNWKLIAKNFRTRNARQCQERWEYYLSPEVNNGPWSAEEDQLLYQKYAEYGSQWKIISAFFKGRTNTNVKNRYLFLQRKKSSVAFPAAQAPINTVAPKQNIQCLSFSAIGQPQTLSNDQQMQIMHLTKENNFCGPVDTFEPQLGSSLDEFSSFDNIFGEDPSITFTGLNEVEVDQLDSFW